MSDGEALTLLRRIGAVLEGHFRYTSGRHGASYVEKFRLLEDPAATAALCARLLHGARRHHPALVVGPTTGGIIVAYEMARQLATPAYFAERAADAAHAADGSDPDRRDLLRGFHVGAGQRVLIVDDVLTTGGSLRQTRAAVERVGGLPVAVAVLVDRSGGRTDFGLPFAAALTLDIPTHPQAACPQCAAGVALTIT